MCHTERVSTARPQLVGRQGMGRGDAGKSLPRTLVIALAEELATQCVATLTDAVGCQLDKQGEISVGIVAHKSRLGKDVHKTGAAICRQRRESERERVGRIPPFGVYFLKLMADHFAVLTRMEEEGLQHQAEDPE